MANGTRSSRSGAEESPRLTARPSSSPSPLHRARALESARLISIVVLRTPSTFKSWETPEAVWRSKAITDCGGILFADRVKRYEVSGRPLDSPFNSRDPSPALEVQSTSESEFAANS